MFVNGRLVLLSYQVQHVQSKRPLSSWEKRIRRGEYSGFVELRKSFPGVDYVYHRYTIFNVAGNKYRLIALVNYSKNALLVKRIWTHAEYDKKKNQALLRDWKL